MLLTEEEAELRLNSPQNLANRFAKQNARVITIQRPGRKIEIPNFTPEDRNEIAFRARVGEKQKDLAAEFGTTQAHVSQLERGQDKSLDEQGIQQRLDGVKDIALEKLMQSLNLIDGDKLKKESASGLSKVASNLSRVIENTSPREQAQTNIQVVVYTPELRKEGSFRSIDV